MSRGQITPESVERNIKIQKAILEVLMDNEYITRKIARKHIKTKYEITMQNGGEFNNNLTRLGLAGAKISKISVEGAIQSERIRYYLNNKEDEKIIFRNIGERRKPEKNFQYSESFKEVLDLRKNNIPVTKDNIEHCLRLINWESNENKENIRQIKRMLINETEADKQKILKIYYEIKERFMKCRLLK